MSLPNNMGNLRKQFYFTLFYTATVVFNFMNSTEYWFVSHQQLSGDPTEPTPEPPRTSSVPGEEGVTWGRGADTTKIYNVPDAPCTPSCLEDL